MDLPDVAMEARQDLKSLPNVHGTGFGPKRKDGEVVTDEPTHLIVFVTTKEAKDELDEIDLVPETVDGVPTDVQETGGEFTPDSGSETTISSVGAPTRQGTCRPDVLGGVYIGQTDSSLVGTASALLRDASNNPVILTNRHVVGTADTDPTGQEIQQGSTYNPDTDQLEPRVIGTVSEAAPLEVEPATNLADSALVSVTADEVSTGYLGFPSADETSTYGTDSWWPPLFHRRLVNVSARTGLVSGDLIAVDVETAVSYNVGDVYFTGLISYDPITKSGSSGSIIGHCNSANKTFHPVALHFAGSSVRSLGAPYDNLKQEHGTLIPDSKTRTERTFFEDEASYFEATPITKRQGGETTITICFANLGYSPFGDSKQITIWYVNGNGTTTNLYSTGVVLESGEYRFVEFDIGELDVGTHTLSVTTPDVEETWTLTKRSSTAEQQGAWTTGTGEVETAANGVVKT